MQEQSSKPRHPNQTEGEQGYVSDKHPSNIANSWFRAAKLYDRDSLPPVTIHLPPTEIFEAGDVQILADHSDLIFRMASHIPDASVKGFKTQTLMPAPDLTAHLNDDVAVISVHCDRANGLPRSLHGISLERHRMHGLAALDKAGVSFALGGLNLSAVLNGPDGNNWPPLQFFVLSSQAMAALEFLCAVFPESQVRGCRSWCGMLRTLAGAMQAEAIRDSLTGDKNTVTRNEAQSRRRSRVRSNQILVLLGGQSPKMQHFIHAAGLNLQVLKWMYVDYTGPGVREKLHVHVGDYMNMLEE